MRILLFVIAVLTTPISVQAKVLTWDCELEMRTDKEGETKEAMHLIFKVDTVSEKAFMEGNAGFVEVAIFVGEKAVSFTEKLETGAIQTTTILGNGAVVHSRNTVILGEIVAAQHFGTCKFQ